MQFKVDDALGKEALESVAVITNFFGRRKTKMTDDATVRKAAKKVVRTAAKQAGPHGLKRWLTTEEANLHETPQPYPWRRLHASLRRLSFATEVITYI